MSYHRRNFYSCLQCYKESVVDSTFSFQRNSYEECVCLFSEERCWQHCLYVKIVATVESDMTGPHHQAVSISATLYEIYHRDNKRAVELLSYLVTHSSLNPLCGCCGWQPARHPSKLMHDGGALLLGMESRTTHPLLPADISSWAEHCNSNNKNAAQSIRNL